MTEAPLTGKQKNHLRGLAKSLKPAAAVGKSGLTEGFRANVSRLLGEHELVKIRLPDLPPGDRAAVADELAGSANAQLAGLVGRNALLYRHAPDLPAERRIRLP